MSESAEAPQSSREKREEKVTGRKSDEEYELEQRKKTEEEMIVEGEKLLPIIILAKKKLEKDTASEEDLVAKYKNLQEILAYLDKLTKLKMCPQEHIFSEIIELVKYNLFRKLPHRTKPLCPNPLEDEIEAVEPLWEHVHLVYTIFQRLIWLQNNDDCLRSYVTETFLNQLMELFNSDDLRERDKVKVVVHRTYCKMYLRRSFLRKKISEVLLRHVYDEEVRGVNQVLQLYGCIVSGFSLPLKEEHVRFLKKVLIPLHKAEDISDYHTFLTYCLVQFLYLDETLTRPIISGLLKYWPKSNSNKEMLFLKEVEDILQVLLPEQFGEISEILFQQIAKCITSPNSQVAEKAFSIWQNKRALTLIVLYHDKIMPVVFPAMYVRRKAHWNQNITNLMYGLFKLFMTMDRSLFDKLVSVCKSTLDELEREEGIKKHKEQGISEEEDGEGSVLGDVITSRSDVYSSSIRT